MKQKEIQKVSQVKLLFRRKRVEKGLTYSSSISAGVLRATSGRINHPTTVAIEPVPAKLYTFSSVPNLILRLQSLRDMTLIKRREDGQLLTRIPS